MAKAKIGVSGGKIFLRSSDVEFPQIEDLFSYKFRGAELSGIRSDEIESDAEFEMLSFRRKPFVPSYQLSDAKIIPLMKGRPLAQESISSLIEYGYTILDGKLYSCTREEREILKDVLGNCDLKRTLKVLSFLRSQDRLTGGGEQLILQMLGGVSNQSASKLEGKFPHPLYKYQREGVQWLLHCYLNGLGTVLADDMGLGKTAQIIGLIAECNEREIFDNALIVVPSTLIENWRREFNFFYPSIVPYLHRGPIRTGLASELKKYKVIIVPYSILTNDIEMFAEFSPDLLFFDEASLLKNPSSDRTICAKRISARSTVAITGTPVENSLLDLWSIADLVFPGYLGTKDEFVSQYVKNDIQQTLRSDLNKLDQHVSEIMLRRLKADHLDQLPDRIDIPQPIEMLGSERSQHDEIISSIRASRNDRGVVLEEINKLQKFTSHPALLSDDLTHSMVDLKTTSAKFRRLFEILEQIHSRGEKVIIFANHHKMVDILVNSIQGEFGGVTFQIDGRVEVDNRQLILDSFGSRVGFAAMVLNPRTAGMGLNITSANHVIHYSRQWNPALEEQATARAYRNGQERAVSAYYLFYINTVEEVIAQRLSQKQELSERVVSVEDSKIDEFEIILDFAGA